MATYFLSATSRKKKDGSADFYIISVLSQNRFGVWKSNDFFCEKKVFSKVEKLKLQTGDAVVTVFNAEQQSDGRMVPVLKSVIIDSDTPHIELVPDSEDDV